MNSKKTFNDILTKKQIEFFMSHDELFLKFMPTNEGSRIAKTLESKTRRGDILYICTDFQNLLRIFNS